MLKRKIYIITLLSMISFVFNSTFEQGVRTFGGNLGFFKDLNANVTMYNFSPRIGYFINDNLMLEFGISYISIDNNNYNPNTYEGYYIDGDNHTTSFGARFFINKLYLGFEFVRGLNSSINTSLGNDFINNITNFDANAEKGLAKVGILTPLGEQIYLDTSLHYMFILDKDIREVAASTKEELTRISYITLGISYFWKPKN